MIMYNKKFSKIIKNKIMSPPQTVKFFHKNQQQDKYLSNYIIMRFNKVTVQNSIINIIIQLR